MNYLAHVTFAEPTEEARLGALLGDFGRGLDLDRLTGTMRFALDEHRALDRWFDAHPIVRVQRARFPERLRRFGGILLDVFADHVLVRHWDHLIDEPLEDVTQSLYRAFEIHQDVLPPRLARIAPAIARDDWLGSYGDVLNVQIALEGIARRMRRETPIAEGVNELARRGPEIKAALLEVLPEAQRWMRERRSDMGRE